MATRESASIIASESPGHAYLEFAAELRQFFSANVRGADRVDDLVQTLYIELLGSRPPELIRDLRSYLFKAAWRVLNRANRYARKEESQTVSLDALESNTRVPCSNALWLEDDTGAELMVEVFQRALQQLPLPIQVAFLLQRRDGRSYLEIAAKLNVTTHTVKKYIGRALREIRDQLDSSRAGR